MSRYYIIDNVEMNIETEAKKERSRAIEALRLKLAACNECPLVGGATNSVLGEGNCNARVVFVGEGPGRNEDLQGRPFVGSAGKILDTLLESIGLSRGDVFITNIVNHRPPGNRDPKPEEITFYSRRFLAPLLEIINPGVVVALGRHAMQLFLGDAAVISRMHGILQQSTDDLTGRSWPVFTVYHPAAALYNRNLMPILKKDFRKLLNVVDHL